MREWVGRADNWVAGRRVPAEWRVPSDDLKDRTLSSRNSGTPGTTLPGALELLLSPGT